MLGEITHMKQRTFYPWLMLLLCCGLAGSSIGILTNVAGLFYTPASQELGVGRGAFAAQATISLLTLGFLTPLVGILLQKVSLRILLGAGVATACIGTGLMAVSQELWQFYVLGVVRGVGVSTFATLTIAKVIDNWFEERKGLATGASLAFSGLAGAIGNLIITQCIEAFGWRMSYFICALIALILALPSVLILRLTPQEMGMLPYGAANEKEVSADVKTVNVKSSKQTGLLSAPFIAMAVLVLLMTAVTSVGQHFPGYVDSIGLGTEIGAAMVSAGMIGNIFFKLVLGVLSDKLGPFWACGITTGINMLSLILLPFSPIDMPMMLLILAFFYGAGYSCVVTFPLLTRRIFGVERYVSVYSILTVLLTIGGAASMTLIGVVYDVLGTYLPAFWGGAAFQLICLFLLVILFLLSKQKKV